MFRKLIVSGLAVVLLTSLVVFSQDETNEPEKTSEYYSLKSARQAGVVDHVVVTLEAAGDVSQFLEDQQQENDKMEFVAKFQYEELTKEFTPKPGGRLQSLRYYELAKANIKIGDQISTPELEKNRRLIACNVDEMETTLFSPNGALKNDQFLLIEDIPGNTLLLDHLLPESDVTIGDTWAIPEKALTSLLGMDLVGNHNLEAELTLVKDEIALVEITGQAEGAFLGAANEMEIRGKFQFDLRTRRITWLALLIDENRSLGQVGPAVQLIAKLVITIKPDQTANYLLDNRVKAISMIPNQKQLKLTYDSPKSDAWTFEHDRRWYVILDEPGSTKVRMLHHGEIVSQCDIAQMPKVSASNISSLGSFQKELKAGLGDNFGEIVSASERTNENGYRELRVIIDGSVREMPLRWVYYLLTDKEGNQAILAFVIQSEMLEVFDTADLDIIKSFKIVP